jgi:hypothetical protein
MNTPFKIARVLVLFGSALALCVASWCATSAATLWSPHSQAALLTQSVYAYRQWRSTGIYLQTGDRVTLTATGQWTYSPAEVGLHGPEGGKWAPAYYPLPSAPGGALLGRVGETGQVFYVGHRLTFTAPAPGLLYLGINDDLLGDNVGALTVKIDVAAATPTP